MHDVLKRKLILEFSPVIDVGFLLLSLEYLSEFMYMAYESESIHLWNFACMLIVSRFILPVFIVIVNLQEIPVNDK